MKKLSLLLLVITPFYSYAKPIAVAPSDVISLQKYSCAQTGRNKSWVAGQINKRALFVPLQDKLRKKARRLKRLKARRKKARVSLIRSLRRLKRTLKRRNIRCAKLGPKQTAGLPLPLATPSTIPTIATPAPLQPTAVPPAPTQAWPQITPTATATVRLPTETPTPPAASTAEPPQKTPTATPVATLAPRLSPVATIRPLPVIPIIPAGIIVPEQPELPSEGPNIE